MGKIYLIKCCKNDNYDFSEIIVDTNVSEIYKIGFTRGDPNKRLKALQTGNPHRLEILKVFETKFNIKLEANLHQQFKNKKTTYKNDINNEWFLLETNDIDNFINTCKTIEKQYDFLAENNYHFKKLLNIK